MTIFFTIIAWIVADLNHVANTRKVKVENEQVTTVINVKVDRQIFTILKDKN